MVGNAGRGEAGYGSERASGSGVGSMRSSWPGTLERRAMTMLLKMMMMMMLRMVLSGQMTLVER